MKFMRKGFLISGYVFVLLLVLLIAVNYVVLSGVSEGRSTVQNMKIDKAFNRYVDVIRALEAAEEDAGGVLILCDNYMNLVLSSPLLDLDGVHVSGSASGCSASFIVESDDGFVHKEGSYP